MAFLAPSTLSPTTCRYATDQLPEAVERRDEREPESSRNDARQLRFSPLPFGRLKGQSTHRSGGRGLGLGVCAAERVSKARGRARVGGARGREFAPSTTLPTAEPTLKEGMTEGTERGRPWRKATILLDEEGRWWKKESKDFANSL